MTLLERVCTIGAIYMLWVAAEGSALQAETVNNHDDKPTVASTDFPGDGYGEATSESDGPHEEKLTRNGLPKISAEHRTDLFDEPTTSTTTPDGPTPGTKGRTNTEAGTESFGYTPNVDFGRLIDATARAHEHGTHPDGEDRAASTDDSIDAVAREKSEKATDPDAETASTLSETDAANGLTDVISDDAEGMTISSQSLHNSDKSSQSEPPGRSGISGLLHLKQKLAPVRNHKNKLQTENEARLQDRKQQVTDLRGVEQKNLDGHLLNKHEGKLGEAAVNPTAAEIYNVTENKTADAGDALGIELRGRTLSGNETDDNCDCEGRFGISREKVSFSLLARFHFKTGWGGEWNAAGLSII